MKDIEILEDNTFKDFVRAKNYKPKSILNHKNGLLFYCNFVRKTPTEVIREAIDEQKNNVWVTDRKIRRYFTGFVDYLVEIGNAPQTIRNKVNWVKTFYKEYGIETPKVKIPRSQHNLSLKPVPDKEVINEVLKRTTIRNRAIILLMASSGMGAAEIESDAVAFIVSSYFGIKNEKSRLYLGNWGADSDKLKGNGKKIISTAEYIIRLVREAME